MNRNELKRLHDKNNLLKQHQHKLNEAAEQIEKALSQTNYPFAANNLLMKKIKKDMITKTLMEHT